MARPILLDIGHSIDDFFAVALAATSPEIELLAVTTSRDECGTRARLVRQLLDSYGRTGIPVAEGTGPGRHTAFFTAFADRHRPVMSSRPNGSKGGAVELMRRLLAARQDVTLVVTGPLTNVVDLFRAYPASAGHIRDLYFMGGWITQALPEHNVRLDAESAARLLHYDVPITAFGYEVTRGHRLFRPHRTQLQTATSSGARFLGELYRAWCDYMHTDAPGMLDPLLITYLAGHLPARFESVRVGVKTKGPGRGTVYRDDLDGRKIRVVTKVDAARYIDFLVARVAQLVEPINEADPLHWKPELRGAYNLEHYAGWSLSKIEYPSHTLAFIESGSCEVHIGEEERTLSAGDALYVPPHHPVSAHTSTGIRANWLTFDVIIEDSAGNAKPIERLPWPSRFRSHSDAELWRTIADRIVTHWWRPVSESRLLYQSAFLELLARLHIHARDEGALNVDRTHEAVLQARRWIEVHANGPVTLEQVAQAAAMSKYHLVRVFKESFGMPPLQYHRQLRMQQARRLLELHHLSIAEVAARVGYASSTSFTKAFKKEYGVAPSDMRR